MTTTLDRRRLLIGAAASAAAGALGPVMIGALAPRGAVIWGSSSASSHRGREPEGRRSITIHGELTALGVPTVEHGYGGWQSPEILAVRSASHPLLPDFSAAAHDQLVSDSPEMVVPAADGITPSVPSAFIPGSIDGAPVGMSAAEGRSGSLLLRRLGSEVPEAVRTVSGGAWVTDLEQRHRDDVHVLWMGLNNREDTRRVIEDTRAAFEVAPDATLVMTHWRSFWNRRGSEASAQIQRINEAYRTEYGERCLDTDAVLWDEHWWSLPEIAELELGSRKDGPERRAQGLAPRPFVAEDTLHLNAYGNLVLAHALHERMESLGLI